MPYIGQQPTSVAFLTDTFNGNGSTTAFTLSAAPANTSSILVAISGVLQDPSNYTISGTTLTFSPAPPSGTSNISVRFLGIPASNVTTTAYRTTTEFTATAGQTTFSVPSYTVGFIDVYRNGVLLGSADYTASSGLSVVLASACLAGEFVEVISFQVSSVLNAIPATTGAVNSGYIASDVTINFAAGSASTPSITRTGDTNTGMFFPIADTIAFAEGGVEQMRLNSSGDLQFNSGYGSVATAYACRAWVSFNGAGTVAIRASGNVSSITDNGVGQYTINFTTAMPDANYCVALSTTDLNSGGNSSQYAYVSDTSAVRTTSAFRLVSLTANGSAYFDAQYLNCAIFR